MNAAAKKSLSDALIAAAKAGNMTEVASITAAINALEGHAPIAAAPDNVRPIRNSVADEKRLQKLFGVTDADLAAFGDRDEVSLAEIMRQPGGAR